MGRHGWGEVLKDDLRSSVYRAIDRGVTFFDTADVYGLGESEIFLGECLKGMGSPRPVVATKFGVRMDKNGVSYYDNSLSWLDEALDGSLKRLKREYIDLYQVHYLDAKTGIFDLLEVLERKRKEGKIRFFGLSNISFSDLQGFALPEGLVSFQMEYSLAKRDHEEEIRRILSVTPLSFISWGSLGQGILTGKYGLESVFAPDDRRTRPTYANFYGDKLMKNIEMIRVIREDLGNKGRTMPQIAIRWILEKFENSVVLAGMKDSSQVESNCGAFGWGMRPEEMKYLESLSSESDPG